VNNSKTEEFVSSSANFLDFASFFCGKAIETLDWQWTISQRDRVSRIFKAAKEGRDLAFQACQGCAETETTTQAEGQVTVVAAGNIEPIGLGETRRIAICGTEDKRHDGALEKGF
jgi:hypothetical protein